MLEREDILLKALDDCYREMFARAQPMADWDNLVEEYKSGKIKKDETVYNRHYLSPEEFQYIENKYMEAYRIASEWKDNVDYVKEYLEKGGYKDKYFEPYTDENGIFHSGYRGVEKTAPLYDQIKEILFDEFGENWHEILDKKAQKVTNKVMELINNCKNYYKFNADEMKWRNSLFLGASPTCNKETVKKWWKDNYNVDIEIEDRNPLLFYEYDYYGDDIDEVMTDAYGKNWKEYWWNKYKEQQKEKEEEREKFLNKIKETSYAPEE